MPATTGPNEPESLFIPGCEAVADLLYGAAVDALDVTDARILERHLAGCPDCQAELESLRGAASLLALSVPAAEPSAELRPRLLAAARSEPQQRAPLPLSAARQGWRRASPAWAVVAACAVITLGTLGWTASLVQQVNSQQAQIAALSVKADRYDRVTGVLASPDFTSRSLAPASDTVSGNGTIFLDPSSATGMIMVHGLPPLPEGRVYQLWYARGTDRVSGGLLRIDATGTGYTVVVCPKDLQQYTNIGVTEEPAGGSPAPTTPRLIGAPI